jgi:CheY-like chemotaxis protein
MRILFLDDDELRHRLIAEQLIGHDATATRTVAETAKALEGAPFDLACLDHDLGGLQMVDSEEEETGHTVAKLIAAMPPERRPRQIIVHSFNSVGAGRMVQVLKAAGYENVEWHPFGRWAIRPLDGVRA